MSLGRRPGSRRTNNGLPTWLVFLLGVAIVFGVYYVWLGVQNFLRSGGQGIIESTRSAEIVAAATAEVIRTSAATLRPSPTSIPPCETFMVVVPNARVREAPSENAPVITSYFQNDPVCVVGRPSPDSEWYTIDSNPSTRRLDVAYMHESVIAAVNPTATPSRTPTPLPTVTPAPTLTPSTTPTFRPTDTPDTSVSPTPMPTLTPSATAPRQSA